MKQSFFFRYLPFLQQLRIFYFEMIAIDFSKHQPKLLFSLFSSLSFTNTVLPLWIISERNTHISSMRSTEVYYNLSQNQSFEHWPIRNGHTDWGLFVSQTLDRRLVQVALEAKNDFTLDYLQLWGYNTNIIRWNVIISNISLVWTS